MSKRLLFFFLFGISLLLISCSGKQEKPVEKESLSGNLEVKNPWMRAAPESSNSAAYLTIWNGTSERDTLLEIKAEEVAKSEVHESYTTNEGLAGMRPAGLLDIASGDSLVLQPGGLHLMLMGVKKNLQKGDSLQLTFMFAKAGSLAVQAAVKN